MNTLICLVTLPLFDAIVQKFLSFVAMYAAVLAVLIFGIGVYIGFKRLSNFSSAMFQEKNTISPLNENAINIVQIEKNECGFEMNTDKDYSPSPKKNCADQE